MAQTSSRRVRLESPRSVAVDSAGTVFIADPGADGVWRVNAAGAVSLLGAKTHAPEAALEPAATLGSRIAPSGVAVDPRGYLVVVDSARNRVCYVDSGGGITALAGNGQSGFGGDGGPAVDALLAGPSGVAVDDAGNVFIADTGNHRIRRVEASTGVISTVAGDGRAGFRGDGGLATSSSLTSPQGLAVDSEGNLWIADSGNNRVRLVRASSGTIVTVAGNGGLGFSGDGDLALQASLARPTQVAVDEEGNLFIADSYNDRVRRVDASTHVMTTFAGNGYGGFSPDGFSATEVALSNPTGVAVDAEGNLYIAEPEGRRVRRVDYRSGVITTLAGDGSAGGGDPLPIADAGPDRVVECSSPEGTLVRLDGSASSDPNGDPLSFAWRGPFLKSRGPVSGVDPQVLLPLGKSVLRLVVHDAQLVSQPSEATVLVTVRPQPAGQALASLVPEGSAIPISPQPWPRGANLLLELRLFCGQRPLGDAEVAPPCVVALAGDRGPIALDSLGAAGGKSDPACLPFHFHGTSWAYDLRTASLEAGTYLLTIRTPDGRRFCAGFVLR